MKRKLLTVAVIATTMMMSCVKSELQAPTAATTASTATSTTNLIVPKGFTWENSRTVNFTVNLTDARFKGSSQTVAIYDGDPNAGGKIITKGSGNNASPFISKLYMSSQATRVYIVKTAVDNSQVTQQIQLSGNNITTSIGM